MDERNDDELLTLLALQEEAEKLLRKPYVQQTGSAYAAVNRFRADLALQIAFRREALRDG